LTVFQHSYTKYIHVLFKIRHDVELYPVVIDVDEEIQYEVAPEENKTLIANSESEFLEILRKIFVEPFGQ